MVPGPTVSVLLARPLAAAMLGGPPGAIDALYAATGLTAEMLADPDARIAPDQLRRAWKEVFRITGDPQFALTIATAMPLGALGIVEYVARTAPTVGEGLSIGLRYLNLLDEVVKAELVPDPAGDPFYLRIVADGPVPSECGFATVVARTRANVGEFRPLAVEFTHRPDGDLSVYERFFEAPVRFGAGQTQMLLSRASLAARPTAADSNLLPILIRHAEEQVSRERAAPPMTAQVRRLLCETLRTGDSDVEHIAARLGLTARSLQRRLKHEGTAFHAVKDDLRRELASRYLEGRLSIDEISFLLGFSEASAFFRAYKRWTGETPVETRLRARA